MTRQRTTTAAWRRSNFFILLFIGFVFTHLCTQGKPVAAVAPPDVPSGHWAETAVSDVVEKGILSTAEDGSFQGDEVVDRYTLAWALHRLATVLEESILPLDAADLDALRRLVEDFRADVIEYYQSREELLEQVRLTHRSVAIFDETLNLALSRIERQQDEWKLRAEQWEQRLAQLEEALNRLEEENAQLRQQLANLQSLSE